MGFKIGDKVISLYGETEGMIGIVRDYGAYEYTIEFPNYKNGWHCHLGLGNRGKIMPVFMLDSIER